MSVFLSLSAYREFPLAMPMMCRRLPPPNGPAVLSDSDASDEGEEDVEEDGSWGNWGVNDWGAPEEPGP